MWEGRNIDTKRLNLHLLGGYIEPNEKKVSGIFPQSFAAIEPEWRKRDKCVMDWDPSITVPMSNPFG